MDNFLRTLYEYMGQSAKSRPGAYTPQANQDFRAQGMSPEADAHYQQARTSDVPVEPSAVQPDDLLAVGGAARHGPELLHFLATKAGAAKEAFTHAPDLASHFASYGGDVGKRLAEGVMQDNPLTSRIGAAGRAFMNRAPLPLAEDEKLLALAKQMGQDMKSPKAKAFNVAVKKADSAKAEAALEALADETTGVAPAVDRASGTVRVTPSGPPSRGGDTIRPGQAPRADGKSHEQVIDEQLMKIADYLAKKGSR